MIRYLFGSITAVLLILIVIPHGSAWIVISHRGGAPVSSPPTINSVSLSNTTFTGGVAGTVGTLSATLSSGSATGSFAAQTTGTDHSGVTCNNYSADFTVSGTTVSNTTSATNGAYAGFCVAYTQTGATNSPYVQSFMLNGNSTGPEIGSGVTLVNNGSTASNVPVRFGFGYARGDMPLGNTIVCQDESANTYPCQVDELSTRSGMPMATDNPGWLHSTISLLYTPSWTASATHTFHIFRQTGTYTPGTGLTAAALTATHHYQILYNNVKDFSNGAVGSGNFTCDLNNAISAGPISGTTANGGAGGVSGGGGGYTITENGQVETTIEALAPAVDNSSGAPHGQIMCKFFVMMWQSSPGSGTLGQVELTGWIGQPWQNSSTGNMGFNWGDVTMYDAATSTTLRSYSHSTTFGASNVLPDPADWNGASPSGYSSSPIIQTFSGACNIPGLNLVCGAGGSGDTLSVSGTTIGNFTALWNYYGSVWNNAYLYVSRDNNPNCTPGKYLITSAVSSNSFTISGSPGSSCTSISEWQIAGGFINNTDNLEDGQPITFSVNNGTLPFPLAANTIYFAGVEVSVPTPNVLSDVSVWKVPNPGNMRNGHWPDSFGVYDQGTCNSGGNCFTVTTHAELYPWAGWWLMADDSAHPFWVAGANVQNTASLYPQPTSAQKAYWESTALIPPYYYNSGLTFESPTPLPWFNNNAPNDAGPYYKIGAVGPQETAISLGGNHMGLGDMGAIAANWVLDSTIANYDLVRSDSLSASTVFGGAVLNAETGYVTPYDCGVYPNYTAYPTLTISGVSPCAHSMDYMYSSNYLAPELSGFTAPSGYGIPTINNSQDQADFMLGVYYDIDADGNAQFGNHFPDFSDALAYIIDGTPWTLRQLQWWANQPLMGRSSGDNAGKVDARDYTINGVHYWARPWWGDEEQRGGAWTFRSMMYGAVLGADNDPTRAMFWSQYISAMDDVYAVHHLYYGQNINNISGGTADPNYEPMGFWSTENGNDGQDQFMYSYVSNVVQMSYALTHFVSSTLPGSSALYAAQKGVAQVAHLWGDINTVPDAYGRTMSTYWSGPEGYSSVQYASGASQTPGANPACADASCFGVWTGEVGWGSSETNCITGNAFYYCGDSYDSNSQGLVQNGDTFWALCGNDDCNALNVLGPGRYYAVDVTPNAAPNGNGPTVELTATPPGGSGGQACTNPTGNTGCPAAFSPSNWGSGYISLAWRPQAAPSTGLAGYGAGVTGYAASTYAAFQQAVNNGSATSLTQTALSNNLARNPLPTSSSQLPLTNQDATNWQMWYMGPATIPNPPPPAQTIASLTASPSTGTCANLVKNPCTTVSAVLSPSTPNFYARGGSYSLVAANSTCTGTIDTADFAIGSTGVISISNINVAAGSYNVCAEAQTSLGNVTNSPQYLQVAITVTQGIPTVTFTGNSNYTYNGSNPNNATTLTGVASGDAVIVVAGYCATNSCGANTPVPSLTATPTSGTCSAISGTQSTGQPRQTEYWCCTGGSGTQTYTINFGGSTAFPLTGAAEFTGTNGCSALETANQNSGSSTTPSVATNGSISQSGGEIVVAYLLAGNTATPTTSGATACGIFECQTPSAAGTISTAWSMPSGGNWGASVVALKHP